MWSDPDVTVVGGGMAGSEAAWQLAEAGFRVALVDMKPCAMSPAHQSPLLGELVCSNSLRSDKLDNAVGLLKEEMRRLGSLVMRVGSILAQRTTPRARALQTHDQENARRFFPTLRRSNACSAREPRPGACRCPANVA